MQTRNETLETIRRCRDLPAARDIHARLVDSLKYEVYLCNLVIQMYGRCGSPSCARRVFDSIPRKNLFSWVLMLTAYAQNGYLQECGIFFESSPERNLVSWTIMLVVYSKSGNLDNARATFLAMPEHDVVAWNAMLSVYSRHGHLYEALRIYDGMEERNVVSTTALLSALASKEQVKDAKEYFEIKMPEWNLVSWNSLLSAYAQCGYICEAEALFAGMPEVDVVSWTCMMVLYARYNQLENSMRIFTMIPDKDIACWNAVLSRVDCGENFETLDLQFQGDKMKSFFPQNAQLWYPDQTKSVFDSMQERSIFSWNAMLASYANGSLCQMEKFFWLMPERDLVSWNTFLSAYTQKGHIDKTGKLLERLPTKDIVSWNSVMIAYAQKGRWLGAIELFHEMVLTEMPSTVTFAGILLIGNHAGALSWVCSCFGSMRTDFGIDPSKQHFASIVDTLARGGYIKEAWDLVDSMPFLPDEFDWASLSRRCGDKAFDT